MLAELRTRSLSQRGHALTFTLAMIETRAALDNVDAIAATPGIDGCFLDPPTFRSRCRRERPAIRYRLMSIASSSGLRRRRARPQDFGRLLPRRERAVALAKRGARFSRSAATSASCVPGAAR